MNRRNRAALGLLGTLLIGAAAIAVFAGSDQGAGEKAASVKEVTLTGTLICVGCDLKSRYQAKAQCSVYGHDHGLKTADGKIYTFLRNDRSKDLIGGKTSADGGGSDRGAGEELHGEKVQVTGKVLPKTQIIDVKDYKVVK